MLMKNNSANPQNPFPPPAGEGAAAAAGEGERSEK